MQVFRFYLIRVLARQEKQDKGKKLDKLGM